MVAFAMAWQGQDANWDLRNYHLYNAIAWVDGRMLQDIAPANMQSWHNPTLDIPMALAVRAGAPGWLVSIWLSASSVIALFFGLRLLDLLWPERAGWPRSLAAGVIAISGAGLWSLTGTTLNDAPVAAAVLGAVWWMASSMGRRGAVATWLPIGLVVGAAVGLKLTAGIYAIGFIAAACFAGPMRQLPARVAVLGVGGVVASALAAGPWMWTLWTLYENPLFPYFNHIFRSPYALPLAWNDTRFLPTGVADALLAPLKLLRNSKEFSEVNLTDPRLFLGLLALVGITVATGRGKIGAIVERGGKGYLLLSLVAFCVSSYVTWLLGYSIYRYLLPLEMLFSLIIVGFVSAFPATRRGHAVALVACALVMVAATKRPGWWRQPFASPMVSVEFPALGANPLIVLDTNQPIAHAVAFLPSSVAAVAIGNGFISPTFCTKLQLRLLSTLEHHAGSMYLLQPVGTDPSSGHLADYGLARSGACRAVRDSLAPLELCPIGKVGPIVTQCR
jgi:MFS family permease